MVIAFLLLLSQLHLWNSCSADSTYSWTYQASYTQSALNYYNTLYDIIEVCGAQYIQIATCTPTCVGDTFLRLYSYDTGVQLTSDDNGCNTKTSLCAALVYPQTSTGCVDYVVAQGCYAYTSCAATVTVTTTTNYSSLLTAGPSLKPTTSPSLSFSPTISPSARPTKRPTPSPSFTPTRSPTALLSLSLNGSITCAAYSTNNTNNAQQNTQMCTIQVCSSMLLTVSVQCGNRSEDDCGDSNNYLRLISSSGSTKTTLASSLSNQTLFYYSYNSSSRLLQSSSGCSFFTVLEGCVGNGNCSGAVVINSSSLTSSSSSSSTNSSSGNTSSSSTSNGMVFGTIVIIVIAVIVGVAGIPAVFCWVRRKRREKLKRAITIVPEDSFSSSSSHHGDLTNEDSTEMVSRSEGRGQAAGRGSSSVDAYRSSLPLAISLSATSAMPTDVSSSSSVIPSLPQADAVLVSNDHVPRAQVVFTSGITTLGGTVGTEEVENWQSRRKPQRRRSSEGGGGRSRGGNSPTRGDRRERRYLEWDEEEEDAAERKDNDELV
eukprot:gene10558-11697_t